MTRKRVVILSGQSLFAEGVASRLGQYPETTALEIINPLHDDLAAQLLEAQPVVIILDANDADTAHLCSIFAIMRSIPGLKIVYLDSQKEQVQVISSRSYPAPEVQDLIRVII